MTGSGRLLENEEVEFLLDGPSGRAPTATAADKAAGDAAKGGREVTMRGDLEKINLSDIFQTLALSKMEGLLRVVGPIDQRDIHFKDGFVRCLVPKRVETLRLGQRLIRAGLINADHLRSALLEQKRTRKSLGELLIAAGLVTEDDIEDVVANQVQEDLFALFTWTQGSFEFYRGAVDDPILLAQLESTPRFDVNGVLLEVARRSDEWQMIIDSVRSLDEIFVIREDAELGKLSSSAQAVIDACAERYTLRELADVSLLGVFECSRTVRELLDRGILRRVTIDEGLDAATQLLDSGEPKRAAMTVRAILDRGEHRLRTATERAAEILARCGEARQAGRALIDAAELEADEAVQLLLARRAREISPRSLDVLVYLHGALQRAPGIEAVERFAVTADLIDELFDRGDLDDALGLVEQLEQDSNDLATCRPRRARILARLGRPHEAIDALVSYAETLDPHADKDRLGQTYEQILKIDYRRKDIAKALKGLHASALARRTKVAVIAAVIASLGFVGWIQFDGWMANRRVAEVVSRINDLLAHDDLDAAGELQQTATIDFGEREELSALLARINQARKQRNNEKQRALEAKRDTLLRHATELLDGGDVKAGLDAFFARTELGAPIDKLEADLRTRFDGIRTSFDSLARSLPEKLPPEPTMLQRPSEQDALLGKLHTDFALPQRKVVAGLLAVREDPRIASALGREFEPFYAVVDRLRTLFDRADELERGYTDRVSRRRVAEELTPVYEEAVRHDNAFEFEAALAAYRTLAENHPAEDELRQHFRQQVERLSAILRLLDVIRTATEKGDFATAQGQLRALRQQYPEIPFDTLTSLPVRVRTTPDGAKVFVDDRYIGDAPVLTSYRPGAKTRIRIEKDGYFPEQTEVGGDTVGLVRSLLVRKPDWTSSLAGTVDRAMVATPDGRVLLTDRAGSIRCIEPGNGIEGWRLDTGDLSGLLSRPVVDGKHLVVTSIDGTVRCLDTDKGGVVWEFHGVSGSAGAVIGVHDGRRIAVVASQGGTLTGLALDNGQKLWLTDLRLPVEADLALVDGIVVVPTTREIAVGLELKSGKERWRTAIPRGVTLPPAVAGSRILLAGDDAQLCLLDGRSGESRWRVELQSGVTASPLLRGERVIVGDGRDLLFLDVRTGTRVGSRHFDGELRTALSTHGDLLFVGEDRGVIHAVALDGLEDRFLLRGPAVALAPVLCLDGGTTVIAFQDQSVHGFVGSR
ncbi:MAG: PQQ-binding-like beta-propeller repeat protein [Planctomycetota bacterium]